MRDFLLAVAVFATVAIISAVDEECIQRKLRGLPVHWPNPTDCASFYRCTNKNIKRELLCPDGKMYNPKTGRCANKGRTICQLSLAAPLAKASNNPCAKKLSGTFVSDSSSCRGFNICNDNLSYPQTCDPGSYFNSKTSACEPDTRTVCWENLCLNKTNGMYVRDDRDCHNFFICYEDTPIVQKCSKGSYFNAKEFNCQPGECPSEETTTPSTPTTETTTTGSWETTTTLAPETTTTGSWETTTTSAPETTTTLAPETTTTSVPETTTTSAPETTTSSCTGTTTTSTCAPETTTTPCAATTTTCAPQTTTTTCTPQTTTTTTCTPQTTTTTTCTPQTTITTCSPQTTTTTCTPQTTTTICSTKNTTTTCVPNTTKTTSCVTETTTACTAETTTTTCSPQETTTTPANGDCSNLKCDSSKCYNAADNVVFPAQNTNAGFCVCRNQKPIYRECPDGATFDEYLKICRTMDKICPSIKCLNQPDFTTFPAANTTTGFCRCLSGQASFFECIGDNYVYNNTLGFCVKEPTELCKGGYSEGDFVSNSDNCMLFSICYEGELVEVSCETGHYFNNNYKACLPDTEGICPDCHQAQTFVNSRRNKRSIRAASNCVEKQNTPAADCDKYYKCSTGHRLLYGCGKDYFFNISTLACQFDVQHICWPATSCTEGVKVPHADDNTKYYECLKGKYEPMNCDLYSSFNKLKKVCITKQECTCPGGYKEGQISAHPSECDKFYICNDGGQTLHACGKGNYFNETSLSCKEDVDNMCNKEEPCLCPGGYESGDLSPHPTDCHKYYICDNGKQVLHDCGKDNYFDNITLTCKLDIHNKCWSQQENCTCPGGYKGGDFSPHPRECSKYYVCRDSQQVLKDCGTNNYFNKNTLACEPDVYHVCWPNLCAGKPNGTLVQNPQQCNAFFLCSNNEATAKTCFEGQWFNPNVSACVADTKAVCYNPCADESADHVLLLPNPICNEFYFCNGGKTFVGTCKVGSFDVETGVCNETKKCFPNPCDNPEVEVFPDAYDPSKFYWCNTDKQPIPYNCPTGMVFDLELKICKKVSDPNCPVCTRDGSFSTLDDNNDSEFCVCIDGLATKIECPQDYAFNQELGVCYSNAPCDPSFCLEAKEYETSPNRLDSKSFCMCFNKKPIILDCPNNGTFNSYTLECSDYVISPECLQSTCVGETSNTYIFAPIDTKTSNGFCQCINQVATFRPCNPGSTLNPEILICQLAEINCNSYQCRGLPDTAIIPSVTSTEGYCECIAGVANYHNCPDNGEFNVTTNKCEAALCDLTKCAETSINIPFPASQPNGFCMCNVGFVPCQNEGTLFSETFGNCMDPCPNIVCNDKPDKYLVASLINKHSFCVCNANPNVANSYEVCPSKSFVFEETEQMCVGNSEELCGTDPCKEPGAFEAKDTLKGFCLCTEIGKKAKFQKCLEGIFVPNKKTCLPTAEDVCDVSLCEKATIEHPITLTANNSKQEFCYCSSPHNAMLLPCPDGKYYNHGKRMCISQVEDKNCSCPNNIAEGDKVADDTTCNKYFICLKGSLESRTCPVGDYFDDEINCCAPDNAGVCINQSNCKCLGIYYENERLPHPINPQMYYVCQANSLHEYKCPTDRIFSANQKQCIAKAQRNLRQKRSVDTNNDHEFGCLENEKRSVPSNCSQYEICIEQTWKRKTCSNYRYYNPEQSKCLEPRDDFVCSSAKVTTLPYCNNSMEYYLVKAKTCQHYYRCQAGKWRLKTCGPRQYFNTKISTCLPMPEDAFFNCQLLGNNSNEEVIKEMQTPACRHLDQRFYSKNCAMYLICLDNDWWYQYCPPDMYYNRTLNYCVRDIHQECKHVIQTNATKLDNDEFPQNSCPQDGFLRPSAMACNRYFVCVDGKWQMQHCLRGEFYDVANAQCSTDKEGICGQLNKDCLPNERRSVDRNCSLYEQCGNEGKWQRKTCPQGEIFDELLQLCTTNQGTCSKHGLKRTCRQNEIMAVKQNCSMFYYCSQDTWSLGNCLKGFMYSTQRQMCVAHMPQDSCKPMALNESQSSEIAGSEYSNPCKGKMDGIFVAHPLDCSRYYICMRQTTSHEMQCSRGSYFEPSEAYCRPNDGSSCRLPLTGVCANASEGSLLPHSTDCKAFYSCSSINGTELLYCPKGHYFDKLTLKCRIDRGECEKAVAPEQKCSPLNHGLRFAHETHCNIYYTCVKHLAIPAACPDNYHFNKLASKCVPDSKQQCQQGKLVEINITHSCSNLSDGTYFADLRDCTRYYICTQAQALPKQCANFSFFDNDQLLCVPDDGSCPYVHKYEDQTNPAPPDPAICEGKHGYLLPDPLNCNNFYACIQNKLKHERCYSQHFFNTSSQQCQQQVSPEKEINSNATTINSNNLNNVPTISKIPKCLDDITPLKTLCSEMSKGSSFAEPGDCRLYISCQESGDEPVSQRCRNGESYDGLLGFCRQNDGTCLLENGQRLGECSGKHGQLVRDPNNCRKYFVCINGQKILHTCKDDEYFSKIENVCKKDKHKVCQPSEAPESPVVQSCDGLNESILYPYTHDNCRSYFQCIKGVAKIHKCADDLYFEPLTIKCIKNETECVMPTETQQRSPTFTQTHSKLCLNKKLDYPYANVDNDCRSFYLCHANGDVTHEWCPLGMIFNKQLIMCTAENKTNCT